MTAPEHAVARDQARDLAASLGPDLAGSEIVLDCSSLLVGTPSFLDEILRQVLVERSADILDVRGSSDRVRQLLERSAENRGVASRVRFAAGSYV